MGSFINRSTQPDKYTYFTGLPKNMPDFSKYNVDGMGSETTVSVVDAMASVLFTTKGLGSHNHYCAIGQLDDGRVIAEYNRTPQITDIAIYDPSRHELRAGSFDTITGVISQYYLTPHKKACDGVVCVLALWPYISSDDEFSDLWNNLNPFGSTACCATDEMKRAIAIMCDNVYRRVNSGTVPEDAKLEVIVSGDTLPRVSNAATNIDAGVTVLMGSFAVFTIDKNATPASAESSGLKPQDLVGMFRLTPNRALSPEEKLRVPLIPDYYIVPDEVWDMAKLAEATTSMYRPVRNFLLQGPAGTGKTEAAKAVASLLGLPYCSLTCQPDTELFDLIGQTVPYPTKDMNGNPVMQYRYQESDLVRALKNGYVCELQEVTFITRPGVLGGLNSLLEGGSITLMTGEVITRHPDAVIILTSNNGADYEGNYAMNQSVIDRMGSVFEFKALDEKTLASRAVKVCAIDPNNAFDVGVVERMAACVKKMEVYCKERAINDGCIGPRSLYDWVVSAKYSTKNPYRSAVSTVINKATSDQMARDEMLNTCIAVQFDETFVWG